MRALSHFYNVINRSIICYFSSIGGKDSLVTYLLAQQEYLHSSNHSSTLSSSHTLDWVYVADGMLEYENSWRLQEIVNMTNDSSSQFNIGMLLCFVIMFICHSTSHVIPYQTLSYIIFKLP